MLVLAFCTDTLLPIWMLRLSRGMHALKHDLSHPMVALQAWLAFA